MKPSVATYFSGGGLKTIGAIAAGFSPVLAVEYNPDRRIGLPDAIASVYADNLGDKHLRCEPAQDVPESVLKGLEGVSLFMASPPCIRASVANAQGGETDLDGELAAAVTRALTLMRPESFILENVRGYRSFAAYRTITDALDALGYWWVDEVVNAADFGVPQSRDRLILQASRTGFVSPLPKTHSETGRNGKRKWNGWYGAVEDLLPGCPETELADWQKRRLPEELKNLLVAGVPDNYGEFAVTPREQERDAPALTATMNHHPLRAVLVETNNTTRDATVRQAEEPSVTVLSGHFRRPISAPRAILERCRVVALTPRCLGRFQTLPDWYRLPEKKGLASTVIGNGIPCLLAQRLAESMKD